uniref:Mucin-16-like n=1 Tax=Phascolarctos cinereus TaxID=38626 RepID=A0A6P5JSU4_PHACI|nr:mucin-16-like [Phascolarctos cinereus]
MQKTWGTQVLTNSTLQRGTFSSRPMKKRFAAGVDSLCTHHIVPANPVLDREKVYWELSRETHGITRLGPYALDKDSLYLDGYNEHRLVKPTASNYCAIQFHHQPSVGPKPCSLPDPRGSAVTTLIPATSVSLTICQHHSPWPQPGGIHLEFHHQ